MSGAEYSGSSDSKNWIYLSFIIRGTSLPKALISEALGIDPRNDSEWSQYDERLHVFGEMLDTWILEWEGSQIQEVMASMSETLLHRLDAIDRLRNDFECQLDLALFFDGSAEPQKSIGFTSTQLVALAKLNLPLEITIYSQVDAQD